MAERAFGSTEQERLRVEERERRETLRLEKVAIEDRQLRKSMAERVIAQRESDMLRNELQRVGRSAMNAAFNRGETVEGAREAALTAEAAYRQHNGLEPADKAMDNDSQLANISGEHDGAESTDDNEHVVKSQNNATPTTSAFMERLRTMYTVAAQQKHQLTLNEPKECIEYPLDLTVPRPICPLTSEAVAMMDDIVSVQREQPWLVAKEARALNIEDLQNPEQAIDVSRQKNINRQLKEGFERKSGLNEKNRGSKNHRTSSTQGTILEQRRRLPAFSMRNEIVRAINDNQITLVKGSTGTARCWLF
jgi:hypothetical protein